MRSDPNARFYELMAISVPDGAPEELIETAESISRYVTAAGGEVLRSNSDSPWGRRRLAYPIRYHSADLRDGFYTLYHFQIQPEGIADIEREIALNERIIRHLLLQLDNEPVFVEEVEEVVAEGEAGSPAPVVVAEAAERVESSEAIAAAPAEEAAPEVAETIEVVEVVEVVDEAAPEVVEVVEVVEAIASEEE